MDDLEIQIAAGPANGFTTTARNTGRTNCSRSEEAVIRGPRAIAAGPVGARIDDHEPACIDEKRALERAKRRHETARQKVEAVRRWTREIDRAVDDCQPAGIQFLAGSTPIWCRPWPRWIG